MGFYISIAQSRLILSEFPRSDVWQRRGCESSTSKPGERCWALLLVPRGNSASSANPAQGSLALRTLPRVTWLFQPSVGKTHCGFVFFLKKKENLEQDTNAADVKLEEENSQPPTAALNLEKPKHFAKPPTPQGFSQP